MSEEALAASFGLQKTSAEPEIPALSSGPVAWKVGAQL
jgi:hypothetical protein